MFFKDGGGNFKLPRGSVKAGPAVRPQQAFLPLLVLRHRRFNLHLAAGRPYLFQGKRGALQDVTQKLCFILGIEVPITQTVRQFRKNEKRIAGLAHGAYDPLPEAKNRSVGHVRLNFVPGGCGEHDIGIGAVGGEIEVDTHQQIQSPQGLPPDLRLWPGRDERTAQDDEGADGVRLALEHRLGQGVGVGLPPVKAIDREAVPAQGFLDLRVGNQAGAVNGKKVLGHGETASPRDIQLPGQRPQDHGGPDGLDAAVTVFQPRIHYR